MNKLRGNVGFQVSQSIVLLFVELASLSIGRARLAHPALPESMVAKIGMLPCESSLQFLALIVRQHVLAAFIIGSVRVNSGENRSFAVLHQACRVLPVIGQYFIDVGQLTMACQSKPKIDVFSRLPVGSKPCRFSIQCGSPEHYCLSRHSGKLRRHLIIEIVATQE